MRGRDIISAGPSLRGSSRSYSKPAYQRLETNGVVPFQQGFSWAITRPERRDSLGLGLESLHNACFWTVHRNQRQKKFLQSPAFGHWQRVQLNSHSICTQNAFDQAGANKGLRFWG